MNVHNQFIQAYLKVEGSADRKIRQELKEIDAAQKTIQLLQQLGSLVQNQGNHDEIENMITTLREQKNPIVIHADYKNDPENFRQIVMSHIDTIRSVAQGKITGLNTEITQKSDMLGVMRQSSKYHLGIDTMVKNQK